MLSHALLDTSLNTQTQEADMGAQCRGLLPVLLTPTSTRLFPFCHRGAGGGVQEERAGGRSGRHDKPRGVHAPDPALTLLLTHCECLKSNSFGLQSPLKEKKGKKCTEGGGGGVLACALLLQSCLTLCDPMDCSPPGSCVGGILQTSTLEWAAMPSSRGSSQPGD